MARPKKNNADYFSHDNNMRNDPKIKALRRKFPEGYMVYNMLLEVLTSSDDFMLETDDITIELLAGDFDVVSTVVTDIIEYCVRIKLLKRDGNYIYSSGLKERLKPVIDNRNKVKQWKERKKQDNKGISTVEIPQSKVKESKVKDILINNISNSNEDAAEISENLDLDDTRYVQENNFDEEVYADAVKFLLKHQLYDLIQKHYQKRPDEVLALFKRFYEIKSGFKELSGKTPNDVIRNFYYWVPKYSGAVKVSDESISKVQSAIEAAKARQLKYKSQPLN